jgi:uncharacterized membrane protein YedE/YeeE
VSKDKRNITLMLGSYAIGVGVMMASVPLLSSWMFALGAALQVPMILFLILFVVVAWSEMP